MRLRLNVKRHGLPDTPVVWVVDTSSSPSHTISQLLEAVNEAIPIESEGDWGLEDYAVELKGANGANYECLHWQNVTTVMKEDDEVVIRPLLTQDLKSRRVSGRRQISTEGKHLFDGLAFGRPLLRRPGDRPPITIPPRKKHRITYDAEEQDEEELLALMERDEEDSENDANKPLVIHADFDDEDSEDDSDDENFVPGADNESEDEDMDEAADEESDEDSEQSNGSQDNDETENEQVVANIEEDLGHAMEAEAENAQDMIRASEVEDDDESALENVSEPQRVKIRAPDLRVPKTRSKAKAKTLPPTESSPQDSVDREESPSSVVHHYDQHGLPPGSIKSGKALSFMAEVSKSSPARPRSEVRRSASVVSNKSVRFALDDGLANGLTSTPFIDREFQVIASSEKSSSDSDDSSEEDASSSDSSDSDDSGASDHSSHASSHEEESGADNASSSGSDSSSDSSSESSSEEEPEETSSKLQPTVPPIRKSLPLSLSTHSNPDQPAPGTGLKATRTRNRRKQLRNALERYKRKGILPAGTTVAELSRLSITDDTSPKVALAALEELRTVKKTESTSANSHPQPRSGDFELRRQQLIDSLASGGVEVGPDTRKPASTLIQDVSQPKPAAASLKETSKSQPVGNLISTALEHVELPPVTKAPESDAMDLDLDPGRPSTAPGAPNTETPLVSPKPVPASADPSQPAARRSRINLGASQRLLFGALGMKAPKNKKDEEKLRSDLMKNVKPIVAPKASDPVETQFEDVTEDPDAWREKIVYRAVECVQEGIVLSEPPFPFVQRWDPQQQWSRSQNGKRKHTEREPQHHQENSGSSKKQKRWKGKHNYAGEQEYLDASYERSYQEDSMELQYDDSTKVTGLDVEEEVSLQLMNDIEAPAAGVSPAPDDLAPLPKDLSSLPDLKDGEAKVGMTIAFRKLDMSEATKWQPVVSSYRTAIVIDVDQGVLHMTLAMRDREHTEKRYDDETGRRIYGRFEMAGADDDVEEDDGMLDLSFGELIEPKILELPPKKYEDDESTPTKEATSFDTPSQEQETVEAQLSHVTETPLRSDAPESCQLENSIEVAVNEDLSPEAPGAQTLSPKAAVQELPIIEAKSVDNPKSAVREPAEDSMAPTTVQNATAIDSENIPEEVEELQTRSNISVEPVSESTKQQIARLMEGVEFRADGRSSVLREIQPESMQSPGEAAAFEKLLKDMTESSEKAYSPKFNGLGSSPIKKLRESSRTPGKNAVQVADSSPTRKRKEHSQTTNEEHRASISPRPPPSSWETIEQHYQSPSPSPTRQADSSWITEDSKIQTSSPPVAAKPVVSKPVKALPKFKPLTRKVPVGRAQALWEQLQPKENGSTVNSEDESLQKSPNRDMGLDGVDERDSNPSVGYPKLSVGSSFTSQVADHGRQPDYDFDDSAIIENATPKAADFDADITANAFPESSPERNSSPAGIASPAVVEKSDVNSESEFEPELPARKIDSAKSTKATVRRSLTEDSSSDDDDDAPPRRKFVNKVSVKAAAPLVVPEPTSSDSDFFPTLEQLSQSATIKREKSREKSTNPPKTAKADEPRLVSGASSRAADFSEDEDQTTPKASQNERMVSQSRSKSSGLEKPASRAKTIAPRASQPSQSQKIVIPPGSQVIDMTLDSSDAEPEPHITTESSDIDIRPTRFRKYNIDTDDDEEYQEETESKWAPKKTSTIGGVESRRQTNGGLKASSQASLNTKNRRKTNA